MPIKKLTWINNEAEVIATKIAEISHGCFRPSVRLSELDRPYSWMGCNMEKSSIYKFRKIATSEYPSSILSYYVEDISTVFPNSYFVYKEAKELIVQESSFFEPYEIGVATHMGLYLFFFNVDELRRRIVVGKQRIEHEITETEDSLIKGEAVLLQTSIGAVIKYYDWNEDEKQQLLSKQERLKEQLYSIKESEISYQLCLSYTESLNDNFNNKQLGKIRNFKLLLAEYTKSPEKICDYIEFLLMESWYPFEFTKDIKIEFDEKDKILIVDYLLPSKNDIPNLYLKHTSRSEEWTSLTESKFNKIYDDIIYAVVIRTLAEIVHYDENNYIESICLNGINCGYNPATGVLEDNVFLSIMVSTSQITDLDLKHIDPKLCFKHLKGVSASKLYEYVAVTPILTTKLHDRRIIDSKSIDISTADNLAEMDWEDFEHLVRQIFEWEFSNSDSEVRVTQSSRDGGVDAIVFDPDPIRGGKIIIQAKRYTNTVPVSAVRDLYGTTINEGANKGILITTSDYGADSYKFAQGKNLTLLNGGHILYLLNKHGKKAHINIEEAKRKQKE